MEELNKAKLCKKIAEWVGWTVGIDGLWDAGNGNYYFIGEHAGFRFTTSLDACEKYIFPKVDSYMLKQNIWGTEHHSYVIIKGKSATASEETPALAFCKAVEKLIDDAH